MGGDLVNGNWFDDSLHVAASLRRLRIGPACEEALAWSKILGIPIYRILWRALRAALPPALTPAAIYSAPDGSYMPENTETSLRSSAPVNLFSSHWIASAPGAPEIFPGSHEDAGAAHTATIRAIAASGLHASVRSPPADGISYDGADGGSLPAR